MIYLISRPTGLFCRDWEVNDSTSKYWKFSPFYFKFKVLRQFLQCSHMMNLQKNLICYVPIVSLESFSGVIVWLFVGLQITCLLKVLCERGHMINVLFSDLSVKCMFLAATVNIKKIVQQYDLWNNNQLTILILWSYLRFCGKNSLNLV